MSPDSPENKCPTVECPDCGGQGSDEGGFRGGKKWKAMSRRNVNFYRCDAPECANRWHEGQRIYLEADDECLDFCCWDCAIRYGLSLEVEQEIPRIEPEAEHGK